MPESATQRRARLKREQEAAKRAATAGRDVGSPQNIPQVKTPPIETGLDVPFTKITDENREELGLSGPQVSPVVDQDSGGRGNEEVLPSQPVLDINEAGVGVTLPDGRKLFFRDETEAREYVNRQVQKATLPLGTISQRQFEQAQRISEQGRQLAGQVGEVGSVGNLTPTPLDVGQTAAQAVVGAIPQALSTAITYGGVGLLAGGAGGGPVGGGIGAGGGAVIGAAAGFVGGISRSITSDMNTQRTDNINAQKRVLDEGKQILRDWISLARADPANRATYVTEFNRQLLDIETAHAQMKIDTQADIGKFNSAIPDLAEFDVFFAQGGERDAAVFDMQAAVQQPAPEGYEMIMLSERYRNG